MTHRIEKKKWILYRHTNNFDLITAVAVNLKFFTKTSIDKENKVLLLQKLKELQYYKERNPELPLDSINHRINTLAYYMFGYKDKVDGKERFLFSPLGNLFLKHIDNKIYLSKIFLSMLWGLQFEHPHGGTDSDFKIYPFRLIFKLLSDERLDYKLFPAEVALKVVLVEKIDYDSYEKLVSEILHIRSMNDEKIFELLKKDEHTFVNSIYEWDYYVSNFFEASGILNKTNGSVIGSLLHGKSTYRKVTKNYVTINPDLKSLLENLMLEFPYDQTPLLLNDPELLKIDVIKQIYNFYPQSLLVEIGENKDDIKYQLLDLAKMIEKYSNNNDDTEAYLFEDVLTDGFNMFINVEAKKIGGAGNADLECLYITKKRKFSVDAKSTKNKLSGINAGRLAEHRNKIGGEYTIVVTPRYVPAVLNDIKSTPIVIIRANTFSEYLYNHIDNNIREIDYADIDTIITSNLGKDISNQISNLTLERFSVSR